MISWLGREMEHVRDRVLLATVQPATTINSIRNAETSSTSASLSHGPEVPPEPSIQSWNSTRITSRTFAVPPPTRPIERRRNLALEPPVPSSVAA